MRSREVSELLERRCRLSADPQSNHKCPPFVTIVGSGHLSYYQASEQGFQGCLGTTRAGSGLRPARMAGLIDRVGDSGTGPRLGGLHRARAAEPASVRGAACLPRGAGQRSLEAGARVGYTRSSAGHPGPRLPGREAPVFAPPGQAGPQERPGEGRRPRPGHRAAPPGPVGLRDQHPADRRGDPAQPHRGRADPGRGRLRAAAARPEPEASTSPATAGRDTRLPRAPVIDFAAFPARADTSLAGLLLTIPDLVALDLPALAGHGRLPRHRGDPRRQPDPVPAGPQAHRHPAGLPRR